MKTRIRLLRAEKRWSQAGLLGRVACHAVHPALPTISSVANGSIGPLRTSTTQVPVQGLVPHPSGSLGGDLPSVRFAATNQTPTLARRP